MEQTTNSSQPTLDPPAAMATRQKPDLARQAARRAEARERLAMAVLTATCLVALVAAWAGDATGTLPGDAVIALAVVAYLGGGGFAPVRALGELRHGNLSVDLLMVAAALGASTVGAWVEGGVLLFLFSLSSTLERFAIHRTRRAIESLLDLTPPEAVVLRDNREIGLPSRTFNLATSRLSAPASASPPTGSSFAVHPALINRR